MSTWVLAVLVPALAVVVGEVSIALLQRVPSLEKLSKSGFISRYGRIWVTLLIVAYLVALIMGFAQFWRWYSQMPAFSSRDILMTISAIAITAWTGSLVAFTIRQRLTPELSRGLRFMIYACFTPIIAATGWGAVLRTLAIFVAVNAALWASVQFGLSRRKVKMALTFSRAPEPGQPLTKEDLDSFPVTYLTTFIFDRIAESLKGWQWSALTCWLAVLVFAFANEPSVIGGSLICLLTGILLAFGALVMPPDGNERKLIL